MLQDTRYEPPPIINEEKLRRLLTLCTTEAPFRHINGTMLVLLTSWYRTGWWRWTSWFRTGWWRCNGICTGGHFCQLLHGSHREHRNIRSNWSSIPMVKPMSRPCIGKKLIRDTLWMHVESALKGTKLEWSAVSLTEPIKYHHQLRSSM